MKKLVILFSLISTVCFSQMTVQYNFQTVPSIKNLGFLINNNTIGLVTGSTSIGDGGGSFYYFNTSITGVGGTTDSIRTTAYLNETPPLPGAWVRYKLGQSGIYGLLDSLQNKYTKSQSDTKFFLKPTGNTGQYLRGDGSVAAFPAMSTITISGDATGSGTTSIPITLANTGVAAAQYEYTTVNTKGLTTSGYTLTDHNNSRAIGTTGFQVSTTVDSYVTYTGTVSCNLSLSGGAEGYILVQTSPDNSTWTTKGEIGGSNTGTLTVGLNTTQKNRGSVTLRIPKSYYVRIVSSTVTGTPTYTLSSTQSEWY